jgi:ABC-type glycerol-3-phosphate transport system substrate-binding protein
MRRLGRRKFMHKAAGLAGSGLLGCKESPSTPMVAKPRLHILRWNHFVTVYDSWYRQLAESWAEDNGIEIEIEYISDDDIVARLLEAIEAGEGPDIVETHAPAASLELELEDLGDVVGELESQFGPQQALARASSLNPVAGKYYALTSCYAVWPAIYSRAAWSSVAMPDGPVTLDDLLMQGEAIREATDRYVGIGFSNEDNTERALRWLLWAHGGSEQDANQNIALDSAETRAALLYARELFQRGIARDDVFNWDSGSNNDSIIAGESSYIINPISAYREAQRQDPEVALDLFFRRPADGPAAPGRVMVSTFTQLIPRYSQNVNAAKDFLLYLVSAGQFEVYNSELYNLPAFPVGTDELETYFGNDPFYSDPPDKLALFSDAASWSANVGYPASANAAVADVFNESILAEMFRSFVRGEVNEDAAINNALDRIGPIFDKWRGEGLI